MELQHDFLMLCQQSWHLRLGTNARSMARELARQHRVLYVHMPLDVKALVRGFRKPEIRQHLRIVLGLADGLTQAEPNLWVYTPDCLALSVSWLPAGQLFDLANHLNSWLLARSLRRAARRLGFGQPVLLQDGIIFQGTELKRLLRPHRFVYYLRDYMLEVPYFRKHGPAAEARLLQRADVVVANSAYLADYARETNPRSYDIGQGCGLDLYHADVRHFEPTDLASVPHPRIGYTGYLTTVRLDLELLINLARQRPDWQLVLVGPEDSDFAQSALHQLPNVHFLGNKTPDRLPAYVQHFDACINPQLHNPTTAGNYPLKIDEYLAMGKPVVATHTRTMDLFAEHVHLARTAADWPDLLAKALTQADSRQAARGVAFARSHTWEASIAKLYAALGMASSTEVPNTHPTPLASLA
jgi:teichuronic acid biosynthesis glycosyltransferase TuaH